MNEFNHPMMQGQELTLRRMAKGKYKRQNAILQDLTPFMFLGESINGGMLFCKT